LGEASQIGCKHIDSSAIEFPEPLFSSDEMNRRAALCPSLREDKETRWELERSECELPAELGVVWAPAQTARDHQVDDQEEITLEYEDDPLADSAQPEDLLARGFAYGRIKRANYERIADDNALESLVDNSRGEPLQVQQDVRELGQRYPSIAS
jgi:hypothetical protein